MAGDFFAFMVTNEHAALLHLQQIRVNSLHKKHEGLSFNVIRLGHQCGIDLHIDFSQLVSVPKN
ncbi:hypothetical protein D3C87_1382310 [compost metagenome]